MNAQCILVTGATGQQGGATIRALLALERKWQLRALVRNPKSNRALALAQDGVEVLQGNLDDGASIRTALAGVDGVFSVQSPQEGGPEAEERQGKRLATAASEAGVRHFVYTSAGGADRKSGIPHFESKWRIEQHIKQLGLPATVLRPAAFMGNFAPFSFRTIMLSMWKTYVPEDRTIQLVAVDDIGRFAARAFAEPDHSIGQAVELAGDAVTRREVLLTLRQQKLVPALSFRFPSMLRPRLPHDYVVMFQWMATCRRSQSSGLVLANGDKSCSDWLPMRRGSYSHCAPIYSPTEPRARKQRLLLTLAANEQSRRKTQEISVGAAWRGVIPRTLSQKSPTSWCFDTQQFATVLRTVKGPKACFRPRWDGDRQKRWLSRTPKPSCDRQIPLAANVSTILRWRARPDDGKHSGR